MLDVLLWGDTDGVDARDVYAAPLPRDRPARKMPADGRGAPWIEMSAVEADALIRSTQAAWDAFSLAESQGSTPREPATVLTATDGTRWKINAAGALVPA